MACVACFSSVAVCEYAYDLNPWSMKFIELIFRNSVPASYKTHHAFITKTNKFGLCREIICVCCKNFTQARSSRFWGKCGAFFFLFKQVVNTVTVMLEYPSPGCTFRHIATTWRISCYEACKNQIWSDSVEARSALTNEWRLLFGK